MASLLTIVEARVQETSMRNSLHHVHVFASDIEASVRFYTEMFGGEALVDEALAGARNVFIRIGDGRLHLYDQPPRHVGAGSIHHFGIQTDDIAGMVERLRRHGVRLRKPLTELGGWRYVMVPAPDDVLIELFEVTPDRLPANLRDYF
jgi:catechol 2,3-dioxygenase-like lactoylglutathione lyase family enzyme